MWFNIVTIVGIISAIVLLIIINSNVIILNKNFIKFYDKFFNGYCAAIVEFLINMKNWFAEPIKMSARSSPGENRVQVSAPPISHSLIVQDARFIQCFRIWDEHSGDDTMEILDLSLLEKYNLAMLEIWITRDNLKEMVSEAAQLEEEISDDEILDYVPPIGCSRADVYQIVDDEGGYGYMPNYKAELIVYNNEEGDEESDDIY